MIFPSKLIFPFSISIIVFIVIMMRNGYKDGFLLKLCDVVSFIFCILITSLFADEIANHVSLLSKDFIDLGLGSAMNEMVITMMNYALVCIVLFALLRFFIFLLRPFLKMINWVPLVGSLNQFLGVFMGFVHSILVLWVICLLFSGPLFVNGSEVLEKTGLIYVKKIGNVTSQSLHDGYDKADSMQKILHSSSLLEEQDYINIQEWLDMYGLEENEIETLIENIKMRSE